MNKDKNEKEELDEEWTDLIKHALEKALVQRKYVFFSIWERSLQNLTHQLKEVIQ